MIAPFAMEENIHKAEELNEKEKEIGKLICQALIDAGADKDKLKARHLSDHAEIYYLRSSIHYKTFKKKDAY
ncbi:hypothetical protein GUG52_30605, partial [Xanthomonas citri pv. citri]|nr:hypothetical protein [Xanthomonas citri pv. citri]